MDTDVMIAQLRRLAEKHKNDHVMTFGTRWSDVCYDVANRLEELLEMSKWTSVKDKLPEEKQSTITHDFEYVLCATTFGDVRAYQFGTPIGWSEPHFWHGAGKMDEYVTHWMPFPDMPVLRNSDPIKLTR